MINTKFEKIPSSDYPHLKEDDTFYKWKLMVMDDEKIIIHSSWEADIKTQEEFKSIYGNKWLLHLEFYALNQCAMKLSSEIYRYRKNL